MRLSFYYRTLIFIVVKYTLLFLCIKDGIVGATERKNRETLMIRMNVTISDDLAERLSVLSDQNDTSKSEIFRGSFEFRVGEGAAAGALGASGWR